MTTTTTNLVESPWGQAAKRVLNEIWHTAPSLSTLEEGWAQAEQAISLKHSSMAHLCRLAAKAAVEGELSSKEDEILELLCKKQADYGTGNILKFGLGGLSVRLWDKIARIRNLQKKGHDPSNESVADSYIDIIGYCVIGIMLQEGTFELPLTLTPRAKRYTVEVRPAECGETCLTSFGVTYEAYGNKGTALCVVVDEGFRP